MGLDKNLLQGSFAGGKGKYSVDLVSGNAVAVLSYSSDLASVSVSASANSKAGLDEIKELIPGVIDDAVISVIQAALGV